VVVEPHPFGCGIKRRVKRAEFRLGEHGDRTVCGIEGVNVIDAVVVRLEKYPVACIGWTFELLRLPIGEWAETLGRTVKFDQLSAFLCNAYGNDLGALGINSRRLENHVFRSGNPSRDFAVCCS